jgi:hypothetical protein
MADRSAAQLVEVRLVELKRVDDSYSQDYAKVHERLVRRLEKEAHPLPSDTVSLVSDELVAWLATLAAKNYTPDRLSHMLRVGLGHLCAEYVVVNPHLAQEEVAIRAYAELQRRGWDLATYDPEVAQAALKRIQSLEASRGKSKKPLSAKAGLNKKVIGNPKIAEAKASKATPAKKEALMALEKKSSPAKKAIAKKPAAKKAVAKTATAKKPAAKKAVAKKAVAKKPAVKKAVAKKATAKKPVAAKKAVAKQATVKKPVAKKAVAKKASAAKAVVAKKPVAKKASAARAAGAKKAPSKKPAIEPKTAPNSSPIEEKKPEFF